MQGIEHLPAPAHKEPIQGMQGIDHLRTPAHKELMQVMWRIEHVRAPAPKEHIQHARNERDRASASTSAKGAGAI